MLVRMIASLMLLSLGLFPARACEQTDATACVATGTWQFNLAMGAGYRSNPLYGGRNWPLWLMPDVSYYAQHWFFDNGTLGYTLAPSAPVQLSLVSRFNEEAGYFRRASPANLFQRQGITSIDGPQEKFLFSNELKVDQLAKRPWALDAGLQLDWQALGLQWRANWWHDISDQYRGQHLKLGAGYAWTNSTGEWRLSAALAWKDKALMNTYYGISAAEHNGQQWQVSADWQPEISWQWQYPLNHRWSLLSMFRYRWINQQASTKVITGQNPLMQEASVRSWFVGLNYRFF